MGEAAVEISHRRCVEITAVPPPNSQTMYQGCPSIQGSLPCGKPSRLGSVQRASCGRPAVPCPTQASQVIGQSGRLSDSRNRLPGACRRAVVYGSAKNFKNLLHIHKGIPEFAVCSILVNASGDDGYLTPIPETTTNTRGARDCSVSHLSSYPSPRELAAYEAM